MGPRAVSRSGASFAARALRQAAFKPQTCTRRHASYDAKRRSIAKLLEWTPKEPSTIVVDGYVRSVRAMKSHHFVALGDGSSIQPLQAVLPAQKAEGLAVGAAVRLTGSWVASPGAGQSHELHVSQAEVVGPSDAKTFPIQKKYQTPDFLRTIPHLRPRTPFNSALLRFRSEAITHLNQFFADRLFTQTHPPLITSSDCEGAGEVFTVAPANKTPPTSDGSETNEDFFRSTKYLTVSTQLHLEALAQAVGNVWTLSPTFRAEKSDTSRHLSEFYMLEAEMSFVDDMASVMDLVEDMLRSLSTDVFRTAAAQDLLQRTKQSANDLAPASEVVQRWEGLMKQAWPRITYTEAIEILKASRQKFAHKPEWGSGLQSEHEKYLASTVGEGKPIFVTDYPRAIKAFYMLPSRSTSLSTGSISSVSAGRLDGPVRDDGSRLTVECFDLLVPEYCEIAGGSMREHRLPQLLDAMAMHGMAPPTLDSPHQAEAGSESEASISQAGSLDWYVDLRRWGCPPHGGFGLGFDRLLCYLSGVQTIRDIVAFPRDTTLRDLAVGRRQSSPAAVLLTPRVHLTRGSVLVWAVAQQPFDLRPLQATICPPDMSLAVACCPPLDSAWMQQRGNPPSASRRLATSGACGRGLHLTSPPPLGSSRVTLEILRPYVGYCPRPSFVQDHADSQRKENLRMPCFMLPRPRARCWEHLTSDFSTYHTRQRPNRSTLRGTGIAISRTANSVTTDLQFGDALLLSASPCGFLAPK
ncbi:uncharacterized protein E0L32_005062 [Thyridium curvatum]|uniref:Aminoacyl-transfer RNA synthetases class-II family profile domain-containing protein n=1 Tax=Thyridium curvatum TaxID=1093900 RepID=A0A507B4J7_9PEZI|nr:uncharacterized protein E0L32_005062 [Thyridium curvatum]TPX14667.1 hypothetical protein E0L32_005062 [Thyridium curvatum]